MSKKVADIEDILNIVLIFLLIWSFGVVVEILCGNPELAAGGYIRQFLYLKLKMNPEIMARISMIVTVLPYFAGFFAIGIITGLLYKGKGRIYAIIGAALYIFYNRIEFIMHPPNKTFFWIAIFYSISTFYAIFAGSFIGGIIIKPRSTTERGNLYALKNTNDTTGIH